MKKVIVILLSTLALNASAQKTEGRIFYTETMTMDTKSMDTTENVFPPEMPKEAIEQIKAAMEKMRNPSFKKVLSFNTTASLYRDINKAGPASSSNEDGSVQVMVMTSAAEEARFTDLKNGSVVEQKEILEKKFLIKDAQKKYNWKITAVQKEIIGYTCQKAILIDKEDTVIAWFTPQIPVSVGPTVYGQLPGAILEVLSGNGDKKITADKVEFTKINEAELIAPKEGKEVTREKFEKIRQDKLKETGGEQIRMTTTVTIDDKQ